MNINQKDDDVFFYICENTFHLFPGKIYVTVVKLWLLFITNSTIVSYHMILVSFGETCWRDSCEDNASFDSNFCWNTDLSVSQDCFWILFNSPYDINSVYRMSAKGYVSEYFQTYKFEVQRLALYQT